MSFEFIVVCLDDERTYIKCCLCLHQTRRKNEKLIGSNQILKYHLFNIKLKF